MSNRSRAAALPRVSVAMIVRDAAPLTSATLASVKSLADEMVVVDTGSGDGTREMASRHGAKVVNHAWRDDFSQARNAALAHVTGEWVLWLDAGETLDAASAAELRQFVQTQADPTKAYMLLVMVPTAASNIAGEQVGRIRLVPNRADLRFSGRVRERIRPSIDAAGLAVEGLPWRILRSANDNLPAVKLAKAQRDIKLLDLEIREQGQHPRLLVALGDALGNLGEHDRAAACFRTAIAHGQPGSSEMREAYYGLLTTFDAQQAERDKQIGVCIEALEKFPIDSQLLCAMGGYLEQQGQLNLAARSYRMAVEHGQVDPHIWHVSEIHEITAICYSLVMQLQNDDDAAQQVLERALERNANSARVRRHLIDLHVKHDRRKEALAEFDKLPLDLPNREALRSAIRGACQAARQNWLPALAYLQTAYAAGCRDSLCLRWLAVSLMATDDQDAALPILEEWRKLEPRSTEVQRYLESLQPGSHIAPTSDPLGRQLRIDAGRTAGNIPLPNFGSLPSTSRENRMS